MEKNEKAKLTGQLGTISLIWTLFEVVQFCTKSTLCSKSTKCTRFLARPWMRLPFHWTVAFGTTYALFVVLRDQSDVG